MCSMRSPDVTIRSLLPAPDVNLGAAANPVRDVVAFAGNPDGQMIYDR